MLQFIFSIFITFIIPAFIISGVVSFLAGNKREQYSSQVIAIAGLGISPLLMSMILYFVLNIFPSKSEAFYMYAVMAALLPGCFLYKYSIEIWKSSAGNIFNEIRQAPKSFYYICLYLAALLLVGYVFVQGVFFPIESHDGEAYFLFSRLFLDGFNPDCYPMTQCAANGFFSGGPWHPPALPLIYVWSQVSSGIYSESVCRIMSPLYSFYLLCILYFSMRNEKYEYSPILACLMLLLTPLFVWQSYQNSIDPLRWFFFYLAFYLFYISFKNKFPDFKECLLLGFIGGCMIYSHISGILAIFSVAAVLAMITFLKYFKKEISFNNVFEFLRKMTLIGLLTLIFGGYEYFKNHKNFGNIMGPHSNYELISIKPDLSSVSEVETFRETGAGKNLEFRCPSPFSVRMQIFLKPYFYGVSFCIFLLAVLVWSLKKDGRNDIFKKQLLFLILIFSIPVLYRFYGNRRYIGTVLPFIICFSGIVFEQYIRNIFTIYKRFILFICISGLIICLSVFLIFNDEIKIIFSGKDIISMLSASKADQNNNLFPDLNEAIDFVKNNTDRDARFIVSNATFNFYMYADRYGLSWNEIARIGRSNNSQELYETMKKNKIGYILLDKISNYYYIELGNKFAKQLSDKEKFELIFDKETKIWKLK